MAKNYSNSTKVFKFEYVDKKRRQHDVLVANVPKDISNQQDLFNIYSRKLNFPDYFGNNWNAFFEVLRNLHWIKQGAVIINHEGIPDLPEDELRIYLEILYDTCEYWKKERTEEFWQTRESIHLEYYRKDGAREHEFVVVFPPNSKDIIKKLLA